MTVPRPVDAALPLALAVALAALPGAPARAADVALDAMKDELARSIAKLRLDALAGPYFVAFRMDDREGVSASAELGALTSVQPDRSRRLTVELRVGDPALDNGNYLSAGRWGGGGIAHVGAAPLDDDYQQIRRQLWLMTDAQYKRALEDLSGKRAALRARARGEDLPDFTRAPPLQSSDARAAPCAPRAEIEALVRELSAVFRDAPEIRRSSVTLECQDGFVRYVNSEGTSFTRAAPRVKLEVQAWAQAPSALPIAESDELFARSMDELPARRTLLERARAVRARVLALRAAPTLERYSGPVLFEGIAAAELFGQQFAPGLAALRRPVADDPRYELGMDRVVAQMGGASFADRIGGRVLPAFLSVTDQPLRDRLRGAPLLGGSRVDDDGVAARETRLVERGILKTLLATRVPTRDVRASTGSRRGPGAAPANLVVTADRPWTAARLRKELLRRAKARGLDHGVVVRRVGVGRASPLVRMATRFGAGADGDFSPALAEVVRLYADGREELLQGVELAELTASAFRDIAAAGDSPHVHSFEFLGGVGALFGGGPGEGGFPVVTCAVPSLLFDDVSLVPSRGPFPEAPVTPSPLARR